MTDGLPPTLSWEDGALRILDQRALPRELRYLVCRRSAEVVEAIRTLAVRGAPALGLAGAYAVALAAREAGGDAERLRALAEAVATARPTAADLRRGVEAALGAAWAGPAGGWSERALEAARTLHEEDRRRCAAIAEAGAELLPRGGWVLTHCHTGALATGGIGTALGAIRVAHARGWVAGVYACEARPLWQGARLTAWECARLGIPCRLLVDAAAGSLLASGRVGAVLVGADRIAANGDVANKVGTYPLAVLAARHGVPFYVLAPWSTVDLRLASGREIPVEERDPREVTEPAAPEGTAAYNPAFDVTPGALVSALVTERGVFRRPYALREEAALF